MPVLFGKMILQERRICVTADEIPLIISCVGLFGWIPVWFFFNGIVKVVRAFKGLDDDGYDRNKIISKDNKED